MSIAAELTGDRFHRIGAAAGHDGDLVRAIDLAQGRGQVAHHLLEPLRHVVQRAVGENDREFLEPLGVDLGAQMRHGGSPCGAAPH